MRFAVVFLCVLACAHSAPVHEPSAPAEAVVDPVESHNVSLADDATAPVRKACRLKGPRLGSKDRIRGNITVDYRVGEDGKVSDVAVTGDATEGAVRAVRKYLESCRYEPATQAGKPVAVRWKGELSFPKR